MRNATPAIEVKPRRVGGATYQVPVDIRAERRIVAGDALAAALGALAQRPHDGRTLAGELMDAPTARAPPSSGAKTRTAWRRRTAPSVHYRW